MHEFQCQKAIFSLWLSLRWCVRLLPISWIFSLKSATGCVFIEKRSFSQDLTFDLCALSGHRTACWCIISANADASFLQLTQALMCCNSQYFCTCTLLLQKPHRVVFTLISPVTEGANPASICTFYQISAVIRMEQTSEITCRPQKLSLETQIIFKWVKKHLLSLFRKVADTAEATFKSRDVVVFLHLCSYMNLCHHVQRHTAQKKQLSIPPGNLSSRKHGCTCCTLSPDCHALHMKFIITLQHAHLLNLNNNLHFILANA